MRKLILTILFCLICSVAFSDTATYYFNAYDAGEAWTTNPANMVNGFYLTSAEVDTAATETQLLTGNTCDGTNLGTISKVELRISGRTYYSGSSGADIFLVPVFSGGDGDSHDVGDIGTDTPPFFVSWSNYFDITTDTNAPGTWSWTDVQNLDCDVTGIWYVFTPKAAKIEIRVTYTPGGGGGFAGKVCGVSSPAKVNSVALANISKISGVE